MTNQEYVKALLQTMNDNPTLEVLCKVESDIVAEDGYAWWLGALNTGIRIEIDEYSDCIGDTIVFRGDENYDAWMEDLFDIDEFADISDDEWEDFCKKKVDEVANWKKAIFVSVTTL